MRRIIAIVATLLIAICGFSAVTAQAAAGDGTYNCSVSGSFTVVNGVADNGGNCTGHADIPSGVTSLGQDAFYLSGLSSISMPNTLTSIGQSALRYIPMTSVTIPSSVQSIGPIAFATTYLTSITFSSPSSLTTIGNYAFQNSRFTSITLPATVTSMGTGVFQLNPNLANINFQAAIPSGSPWEAPVSAIVASTGCTTGSFSVVGTVLTNGSTCTGTANVPVGVTAIGANAFLGATSLTTVNLPSSLTSIGDSAFKGMTGLTAITIPSSVTSIAQLAFFDTRLVSLTIPSSVTSIANDTFGRIATLTSITLPSTLTTIGGGAFFDATGLTSVSIPSSVTTIGQYAFGNNTTLSSVTFLGNAPATVDSLAFYHAPAGTKAIVGQSATGFGANGTTWKGLTIEQSTNGTYSCLTGLASSSTPNFTLTSGVVSAGQACVGAVVLPSLATSIGANAFSNATLITSIEIPNTITSITAGALLGLSALTAINVDVNNANYSSNGGVLLNKAGTTLVKYPAGKTATSYTVSRTINSIVSGAFDGPSVLATMNFEGNAPASVGPSAFSGLAAGARAVIEPTATGFASIGSTWNGLTVASNAPAPTAYSAPAQPAPVKPLPKVSGLQLGSGKTSKSTIIKVKLSGAEQGSGNEEIQIKIFDARGNLFKTLTVPIDGVASSMEVNMPLALGEFTVEANTISAAGGVTDVVSHSSPIVSKIFYSTKTVKKTPVLYGDVLGRPVTFGPNSAAITSKTRAELVLLSEQLRLTRSSLAITGFTAKAGASSVFEKTLAKSRAMTVAKFLKAQGLNNILYVSGYGAISNSKSLADSRKVEMRVIK